MRDASVAAHLAHLSDDALQAMHLAAIAAGDDRSLILAEWTRRSTVARDWQRIEGGAA